MYKFADLFSIEAREFAARREYKNTDLYGGTKMREVVRMPEEDVLFCPIGNMIVIDFPDMWKKSIYRAPTSVHVLDLFGLSTAEHLEIAHSVSRFIGDFERGELKGGLKVALGVE